MLRGDARALPLPAASVDLIVTSPPSEPTIADWLAVMLDCTREMARVLKPSGAVTAERGVRG
ncbi:methyltransferase domain-containing protein [Actinokineospora sp.]|uniref:methyltransferase domain-containing protein n=1 Tax=Actinokineospora sp. TaxID=1872133 RepID=UPI003D6B3C86